MSVRKRNFTLTFIITSLLLVALTLCAGCAGNSSSTAPAVDASGAPPPSKAFSQDSEKPVSVPDASPKEGGVPLLVHLWDGGSYDPNGVIVKWEWNFGDALPGEPAWQDYTATAGEAWHWYTKPGVKVAHLRVTDNDGNIDVAFVKIYMRKDGNANPVALAKANPTEGNAPLSVDFSATGSYDPDGSIVKYEWDFGDGGGYEEFTDSDGEASYEYGEEGTYTAVLRVTDDDGAVSMSSVEITVSAPVGGRGDWWMFGREPTHNRRSPFTGPTTNALKWSYTTGGGIINSSPAIGVDGTIYVGSLDNKLYAVNPDGMLKWTYTTGGDVFSCPAIGLDGTIYVGSYDFKLYAINQDGSLKWSYTTGNAVLSSPTIGADGTIYVGCYDHKLYAINPDGSLKWSYTTGLYVWSSPAIGTDGTVYVGSYDGNLYAINPDGTLKWNYTTGSYIHYSSPAIGADGTIYVGSADKKLYAINPDGTLKWSYTTGSFLYLSPAIGADGAIYVGAFDNKLYAINPDGTLNWSYTTGGIVVSSAAIDAEGTIYVGSAGSWPANLGTIYAISPDGTLKWSYATGGFIDYFSPAIGADGTIYIGSADSKLYAFGPGEGV